MCSFEASPLYFTLSEDQFQIIRQLVGNHRWFMHTKKHTKNSNKHHLNSLSSLNCVPNSDHIWKYAMQSSLLIALGTKTGQTSKKHYFFRRFLREVNKHHFGQYLMVSSHPCIPLFLFWCAFVWNRNRNYNSPFISCMWLVWFKQTHIM